MTASRAPLLVAVSGPDTAGTSSLVRRLAALLRERGVTVVVLSCHGCLLCRRLPVPSHVRETEPGRGAWARRATDPERRGPRPRRVHAFLDAAELAARLAAARLRARTRARGGQAVLLTDHGPLDELVRFGFPAGSAGGAGFRRIADGYGLTLLVETGPETLWGFGPKSAADSSAAWWDRCLGWSRRLPGIVWLDGDRAPALVVEAALERILDVMRERERAAAVPEGGTAGERRHVVVSVYDGADAPASRSGGALVAGKVARRLAEDFRVTVVTAGRRGGTEDRDGIRYVRLPVGRAGPRTGRLLFLALLPFAARRIRHDLWLESFTPPFSTSFLPLTTGAPVIGIDQGRHTETPWRRCRVPFLLVERLGLRCYRHIVALNTADGSTIHRLSPRADVQVIPNGVDQRLLDETLLGSGQFILFLGRIDTWVKGLDLLLDAYDRARPPLDLLLAGSGVPAEERRLAALVAAHAPGPEPRIHWVGYAGEERKRQLLRDSAFLVMPSRHETFGLVALEGMSYGKPVLHFDLPALRWMRGSGDVAVPPFDVAAFGARMTELATDAALRRRLGHRAGITAQHYAWDEVTGRYLALAHRLLDSPTAARRPRKRGASWQTTR
ncbi:glycosyltransferase family 4 protein [Streptomyces sp. TLI_105]|uniref:glycosyltransferase family 4 protein n=1 Tax=Streptomyces sp. TLI_105 TaxID=1881019 RepID=UPI000894B185|nr:glycosyltransferase family 4 protein [Streptomyces sp. TLI_105]SED91269.1 Glycosyltransferase involved in cell wall bisynthesis [Streptomyces sp. TLI_105]